MIGAKAEVLGTLLARPLVLAGGLFSSGLALGLGLMIQRALWLQSVGPICGGHAADLHCPGCYAAAAMMIGGAALAASQSSLIERP